MIELDALSDSMLNPRKLKVSYNVKTDIVWSLIKKRVVFTPSLALVIIDWSILTLPVFAHYEKTMRTICRRVCTDYL